MILSQSFLTNTYSGVISSKVLSLLLIIFLWMALSSLTAANETDCGLPECKVKYSCKNEAKAGCEAINRAVVPLLNFVSTETSSAVFSSISEAILNRLHLSNEGSLISDW